MTELKRDELARMIDHTILETSATKEDVERVCGEAIKYGFGAVCTYVRFLPILKERLKGTDIKAVAVIDFPEGKGSPEAKRREAREALGLGADELDMVIDKEALKRRDYRRALEGIRGVVDEAHPRKVKVIIETCDLTHEEKVAACVISKLGGAAFVKTSTGFGKGGARPEDVALMKDLVGDDVEVKASGGIRTYEDAKRMIEAGATRIGASKSIAILEGAPD